MIPSRSLPLLFALAIRAAAAQSPSSEAKPVAQSAPPVENQKLDVSRHQKLAEAATIAQKWQDSVKAGHIEKGLDLWGYQAFERVPKDEMLKRLTIPPAGKLTYTALLEDRCAIDPDGMKTSHPGNYITLRYYSEYETGARRETIVLHEPASGGQGLKIIAVRRQQPPGSSQGVFDLAANLGQIALLKIHGAPKERWEPLHREALSLAAALKIKLPEIPEPSKENDESFGAALVELILKQTPELLASVPRPADAPPSFDTALPAAKAILNAYALMLLYQPGQETAAQLAVIVASEAESAKLPVSLYKPLVERVHRKAPLPEVHEAVLTLASDISHLMQDAETAFTIARAPSDVLQSALKIMAKLPTYQANARFTAADGRNSTIEAILAPGAIDLVLTGFDGAKQMRNASKEGFFLSTDEGKTWARESGQGTTEGLCRTVQSPLDAAAPVFKTQSFQFEGIKDVEGEQLYHFSSNPPDEKAQPVEYWVLLSGRGPVIRQAKMTMKFGDMQTDAFFRYTKLGKEVERFTPSGQLVEPGVK